MAKRRTSSGSSRREQPKFRTHPLVEAVLNTETGLPDDRVVIRIGYLCLPTKGGPYRLYTSLDFLSYYEIPPEALVHRQPTVSDDDYSPDRVFAKASATTFLRVGPGSYLEGRITDEHFAEAAASQAVEEGAIPACPSGGAISCPQGAGRAVAECPGSGPAASCS